MKIRHLVIIAAIIFVGWLMLPAFAKITLTVVDEQGKPVEEAKVEHCFYGDCLTKDAVKGSTDKNGIFIAFGSSSDGVTGGVVKKAGYYNSVFHHDFIIIKNGFWLPWNKKIQVVLRPIVNPVPMFVRNRTFLFPAINEELGFDLTKSDWLPPYGKGVQSDFILRVDRIFKDDNNFDATLTLTFSKQDDGIQVIKDNRGGDFSIGSRFILPRMAPEDGYQAKIVKRVSSGSYGSRPAKEDDNNYIFRVRSEVRDGRFIRAMYGKILGDIRFGPVGGNGGFEMHYYLNPDYTRNLEFDPKRNLFINLPEAEGVALP